MEHRRLEEEEDLMQEALALLTDLQDDDYNDAISRLLLPSDDYQQQQSPKYSDSMLSNTEVEASSSGIQEPRVYGLTPTDKCGSGTPPALTTSATSEKKTLSATAKQLSRKKRAPVNASGAGKKRKAASYNSNRARDERKEELIYLRKTVQTMEARLRTLQLSQHRAVATSVPAKDPPRDAARALTKCALGPGETLVREPLLAEDASDDAAMGPVWTEIAAHQYQERRRVELENIRLRLILEGQIKMAKSLEKMLTKRTSLRVSSREVKGMCCLLTMILLSVGMDDCIGNGIHSRKVPDQFTAP